MKRIFIAVKVEADETFLGIISSLISGLDNEKIRWTKSDNIHITLAFLGDTEENRIDAIASILREQCNGFGKFEINIKGLGIFKSIDNPRVIWTGIESSEKLLQLNRLVIKGLKGAGFPLEDRSFNPHLTIGRLKYLNNKVAFNTLREKFQNMFIQKVPVNEIILYESILYSSGPVYKQLDKFDL